MAKNAEKCRDAMKEMREGKSPAARKAAYKASREYCNFKKKAGKRKSKKA
jgi:hypothetical protein